MISNAVVTVVVMVMVARHLLENVPRSVTHKSEWFPLYCSQKFSTGAWSHLPGKLTLSRDFWNYPEHPPPPQVCAGASGQTRKEARTSPRGEKRVFGVELKPKWSRRERRGLEPGSAPRLP